MTQIYYLTVSMDQEYSRTYPEIKVLSRLSYLEDVGGKPLPYSFLLLADFGS